MCINIAKVIRKIPHWISGKYLLLRDKYFLSRLRYWFVCVISYTHYCIFSNLDIYWKCWLKIECIKYFLERVNWYRWVSTIILYYSANIIIIVCMCLCVCVNFKSVGFNSLLTSCSTAQRLPSFLYLHCCCWATLPNHQQQQQQKLNSDT